MEIGKIGLNGGFINIFDEPIFLFFGVIVMFGVLLNQLLDILVAMSEVGIFPSSLVVSYNNKLEGVFVAVE